MTTTTEPNIPVQQTNDYDADAIISLDPITHIQKRPTLTLGTFERMQLVSIREVIDNVFDESRAGFGKSITITLGVDGSAEVIDCGRGVPVGINSVTKLNGLYMSFFMVGTGGKFGADNSGYSSVASLGLNGIGVKATMATSLRLDLTSIRDGKIHRLSSKNGKPGHFEDDDNPFGEFTETKELKATPDKRSAAEKKARPTGTTVKFWPNPAIFGPESSWRVEELREILKSAAFFLPGVKITLNDNSVPGQETSDSFEFDGGLIDMLESYTTDQPLHPAIEFIGEGAFKETVPVPQADGTIRSQEVERVVKIDTVFRWGTGYDTTIKSYVNTINTTLGGVHVQGFERALNKVIIDEIKSTRGLLKPKEEAPILDDIKEGLSAVVSIAQNEVKFVGQDKQRLSGGETLKVVQKVLTDELKKFFENKKNATVVKIIKEKVVNASRIRLAQREQKETARRKTALTSASMPAKLLDCAETGTEFTELLICEGDSALGTLKGARDARYQALLPIRGKILNVHKASTADTLKNAEISDIIQVLGAGFGNSFDLEQMRVNKLIICADADQDGLHIISLLTVLAIKLFRPMVEAGRLFVAVPPLYVIKTKGKNKEIIYAENETEKEKILARLTKSKTGYDINRLKGLGEMDADQFWDTTLNPEARTLRRIDISDSAAAERILDLAMGKEVEPRKEWIMNNRHKIDAADIAV